ncbi:MAG: FadR family transcriptional regulator [Proteobacteria bacterium]|nr:FadR family transcriptional regulator [Pseudomonadota bacterium]
MPVTDSHNQAANALAHFVEGQLASGAWPLAMKLPAERELGARFLLSRGAVRKVLDGFIARGLLRRAAGSGTYVASAPTRGVTATATRIELDNVSPAELMEARRLFEPLLPRLIVRHATPQDFARFEQCLLGAEQADSVADFEYWDGALHEALSAATHNSFIGAILALMAVVREAGEWGRLKQQALTPARRKRYEAQHRALVAALRERDEAQASALLKAHLDEVQANLFGA